MNEEEMGEATVDPAMALERCEALLAPLDAEYTAGKQKAWQELHECKPVWQGRRDRRSTCCVG